MTLRIALAALAFAACCCATPPVEQLDDLESSLAASDASEELLAELLVELP